MSENNGIENFLVGFLAGAIVGGIATILYAPTSGEETRSTLKAHTDDFLNKANVSVDDAYKQAESAAREASDRFEKLAKTTRERAEDITRRGQVILEEQINNFKKGASEAKKEGEEEILMAVDEKAEAAEPEAKSEE